MSEIATAWISLVPSMKNFGSTMTRQVGGEADKAGKTIGSRLGNAMKLGLVGGGVALAAFAKSAITAGSEAQQSIGATETVFGKFASTVIGQSNKAAQAYGLSANEYRENANLLGSLFKNQGVSMDALGSSTDKMIGRAADLAATFGGPTSDAVAALGSAFKGEFDSLERFGISLKESTVSALLAKRGQDDLTGSALAAAKQQAVTSLIFKQSKDSMGAFGKESNTLAGQQQRLGAQFENIKATLGMALLPILTRVAEFVNSTVLPAFTDFTDGMRDGTGAGGVFATVLGTVGNVLTAVGGFVKDNKTAIVAFGGAVVALNLVMKAHAVSLLVAELGMKGYLVTTKLGIVVSKAFAAAQWVLNAALSANPIGLVIVGLAALVAGLVIAYKKSETFRSIVDKAFRAVAQVGQWLWENALKPAFEGMKSGLQAVGKAGIWLWNNALQPAFKFIVGGVASVLEMWAKMLSALGNVPGFGWAKDAAAAMGLAAGKAAAIAAGINKIPNHTKKVVEIAYQYTGLQGDPTRGRDPFPARAAGGPVMGGTTYLVGEKGPELFTPKISGHIVPNHQLSGSSGGTVVVEMGPKTLKAMASMDAAAAREFGREINGAAASAARAR